MLSIQTSVSIGPFAEVAYFGVNRNGLKGFAIALKAPRLISPTVMHIAISMGCDTDSWQITYQDWEIGQWMIETQLNSETIVKHLQSNIQAAKLADENAATLAKQLDFPGRPREKAFV